MRANPYARATSIHFRVTALDLAGHRATQTIAVVQAARPPTPAPSLAVATTTLSGATVGTGYSAELAATGGTPPYTWALTAGTLPPGLTVSPSGGISGTPTTAGQWGFTADVTDSQGQSTAADLAIAVVDPAPTTPSVPTVASSNWSGYVLAGGPFSGATGTFDIPSISASPTDTSTAEWVGIDGYSSSDPTIIQAGVAEDYQVSTNQYYVHPWIELFPAPAFSVPLQIAPGNQVTVTIGQNSPGIWTVYMKNDSTGEEWATQQAYSGPALSAEWVVEAPTLVSTNSVETVGVFSPITFSQIGVNPNLGLLSRWVMVQNGLAVSTPSPLTPNGFTVGYGEVTPTGP